MTDYREANPPYYGWVPNEFLDALELSTRTDRILRTMGGVDNVGAFMELTRAAVTKMKGAGTRTWQEVRDLQDCFRTMGRQTDTVELAPRWSDDHKLQLLRTLIASTALTGSIDDGTIAYWIDRTHKLLERL